MVVRPAAVVIVNDDLTDNVQAMIVSQLHINEVIDGYDFDSRISADSAYVDKVKQLNQRILVIRDLDELSNREYADVVAFCSHGLFSVLQNKFGPPGKTVPIVNLSWGAVCIYGPP